MKFKKLLSTVSLALAAVVTSIALAGEITWIDVRSAEEFKQQHVEGALNIPYEEIDAGIAGLRLEKDSVIYLYCRTGRRSGIAKASLDALGYTGVVNVGGLEAALAEAEKTPAAPKQ
jgi:phage shock protein E